MVESGEWMQPRTIGSGLASGRCIASGPFLWGVKMQLCQCGCGEPAPISKMTRRDRGIVAGQAQRFILGHNNRGRLINFKTGRTITASGYAQARAVGHPRARSRGHYVFEHILVVERVIGKYLPAAAVVHHVNGDTLDNRQLNLVACQDQAYHNWLHARIRERGRRR